MRLSMVGSIMVLIAFVGIVSTLYLEKHGILRTNDKAVIGLTALNILGVVLLIIGILTEVIFV